MKTTNGKNGKCIKSIHVSDVHMGHPRISPMIMTNGLDTTITNKLLNESDFLFIAGDFWDKALSLPGNTVPDILLYISSLLKRCVEFNVRVRILEGTPSHDRKQSNVFNVINFANGNKCDLRYIDKLYIDYEKDFDMYILYVPDEWKNSIERTWDDVLDQLKVNNLDKVDMAIMHGMFGYQMPAGLKLKHHDEKRYLNIVDRYISIGHVHTPSMYDRIFAQGSHDRLRHNEEEAKGLMVSEVFDDITSDRVTFIENKLATPFKIVDITKLSEQDAAKAIDKVVISLNNNIAKPYFIRVDMRNDEISKELYKSFKKAYSYLNWSNKIIKDRAIENNSAKTSSLMHIDTISKDNVIDLVTKKLSNNGKSLDGPIEILQKLKDIC